MGTQKRQRGGADRAARKPAALPAGAGPHAAKLPASARLAASKEQIQSSNDELTSRNDELQRLNDDLTNLLTSLQIAMVIVGRDLRIRRSSAKAEQLLNVAAADVGKPIAEIEMKGALRELAAVVREAIDSASDRERDVQGDDGRWYSLRVHPSRTADRELDGAVVMLVDVHALHVARDYAESIIASVRDPLLVLDADLRVRSVNSAFYATFQVESAQIQGRSVFELGNGQWDIPELRRLLEVMLASKATIEGFVVEHTFERIGRRTMRLDARKLVAPGEERESILLAFEDVTELHRSAAQLRHSEQRYRRLFESAQDGVLILDAASRRIIDANPFMTELLGYSREELLGKGLSEIGILSDEDPAGAARREPSEKAARRYTELTLETKHGEEREVELVSSVYEEDGVARIQCNVRDIRERKRVELALAKLAAIVENSDDAIVSKDLDGVITSWNKGAERVFGYTADEAIGQSITMLIPPDRRDEEPRILALLVRGEYVDHFDTVRVHKDGSLRDVSLTISPLKDSTGRIVGASKIARDVTERKRAQVLMDAQKQALQLLAVDTPLDDILRFLIGVTERHSPDGVLAVITPLNSAGTHFGRGIGPSLPAAYHAAIEGLPVSASRTLGAAALKKYDPVVIHDLDADPAWQRLGPAVAACGLRAVWCVPIRSSAGRVLGTFCTFSRRVGDPTPKRRGLVDMVIATAAVAIERRRAEEELARRNEALTEADKEKNNFLAILAHELRSPLNAICGWVEILKRPNVSPERIAQGIEIIDRQSHVQAELISDLMDAQRLATGKVRLEITELDLAAVVDTAIQAVLPSAAGKGVSLEPALEPGVYPAFGDENRLQQVLWNLLSNAIKFTPPAGKVRVVLRRAGPRAEIEISDTGVGITAEALPHLFERFRQADPSVSRGHGGLGLGLAIVKQLVDLHGGEIRGESAGKGLGAKFTITLPLRAQGEAIAPKAVSESAAEEVPHALTGTLVLIVEDDVDAREALRQALEAAGAEVIAAGSADEATTLVRAQYPDILVSDIGMPGRDGHDLVRDIRGLAEISGGRMPAIALTSYASERDRERALEAGFDLHLAKPVKSAVLIAAVLGMVERAH